MNIVVGLGCLVTVAVLRGVTGVQEPQVQFPDVNHLGNLDDYCTTYPAGIHGKCIRTQDCPRLNAHYEKAVADVANQAEGIAILRNSVCSVDRGVIRLCCEHTIDTMSFDDHISKHGLTFNETEKKRRNDIFMENSKAVQDHHTRYLAGTTTHRIGFNQFSHLNYEEFISEYTGLDISGARQKSFSSYYIPTNLGNEPSSLDWVKKGMVNRIREQGKCGSCWAFATTSVIESQIKIKKGVLQQLSEQYLVDCDTNSNGCINGDHTQAIDYVIRNGIDLAKESPYTSHKSNKCSKFKRKTVYMVTSTKSIRWGNDAHLLNANYHIGPISVAIHITKNFKCYHGGVLNDNLCTDGKEVNHSVVLVGYGTENGQEYWLVRNSHGTKWGESGYLKLSRSKLNHCLISSFPVFPVL